MNEAGSRSEIRRIKHCGKVQRTLRNWRGVRRGEWGDTGGILNARL